MTDNQLNRLLEKIGKDYEDNFNRMANAFKGGDKEAHRKYLKIERRLNWRGLKVRRELNIII